MSKYGAYTLIALSILVFIYRFDIIIETFKGTENVPYYQLLTPLVLLVVGFILLKIKNKKNKEKKDESNNP